jgi:hypothetical protein
VDQTRRTARAGVNAPYLCKHDPHSMMRRLTSIAVVFRFCPTIAFLSRQVFVVRKA